eukprot:3782180-Pyramimonas_sp.AAC.1
MERHCAVHRAAAPACAFVLPEASHACHARRPGSNRSLNVSRGSVPLRLDARVCPKLIAWPARLGASALVRGSLRACSTRRPTRRGCNPPPGPPT